MKPRFLLSLPLICCSAFAQGPTVPPPIIQIVSTPGRGGQLLRPYATARVAVDVVGLAPVTGTPQNWWIEMHPTFASIEALDQAMKTFRGNGAAYDYRAVIAVLQPGWSYRPEEAVRGLSKARYVRVTIHRIGAGLEAQFDAMAKSRRAISESVNSDRPNLFYHVVSGDDSGAYIVLSPLDSLSVLDEGSAEIPTYAAQAADTLAKNANVEITREHLLFRVDPLLSFVSDGFAAGDPGFWHP